jgi:hypothetical protein
MCSHTDEAVRSEGYTGARNNDIYNCSVSQDVISIHVNEFWHVLYTSTTYINVVDVGGLVVIVPATGPKVLGFNPA